MALPKPARGWIHAIMAPLALANSVLLLILRPHPCPRCRAGFGISAVLLREFRDLPSGQLVRQGARRSASHRPCEHFLTHRRRTPLSVMLLEPKTAALVLGIVWTGAIIGTLIHVFHITPRAVSNLSLCRTRLGRNVVPSRILGNWWPGNRVLATRGRPCLHGRCRLLRHALAQPVAQSLRVPRVFPCRHRYWLRLPFRCRLVCYFLLRSAARSRLNLPDRQATATLRLGKRQGE